MSPAIRYTPSSDLADIEIGQVFTLGNGKRYILMARNPWDARIVRFTFLDDWLLSAIEWLEQKFKSK